MPGKHESEKTRGFDSLTFRHWNVQARQLLVPPSWTVNTSEGTSGVAQLAKLLVGRLVPHFVWVEA